MTTIRFDFDTQPPATGIGSWSGVPLPGLSSCVFNTLWQTGGYWEMTDSCEVLSRFYGECLLWLHLPGLKFDEARISVTIDHAYPPPGGQNSILQIRTDDDLFGSTLHDTYTFSVVSDDTDLGTQEIVLTPASVVGDNYAIIYLGVWGSSDTVNDPEVVARINSVEFVNSDELRHTGLAADQARLYVTANQGGTLRSFAYDLETLTVEAISDFGAVTYAELDARSHGIFPVTKPGVNGDLFARGRDGNDNQVLRSVDSGESFANVGDAGWSSSKYCVALLPDPLNSDDIVACFDDDDLYRSEDGSDSWAKTGDSPVTLREAGRHYLDRSELLLAAQAADSLRFTNNQGGSFDDISDSVGTVNAVEVSL